MGLILSKRVRYLPLYHSNADRIIHCVSYLSHEVVTICCNQSNQFCTKSLISTLSWQPDRRNREIAINVSTIELMLVRYYITRYIFYTKSYILYSYEWYFQIVRIALNNINCYVYSHLHRKRRSVEWLYNLNSELTTLIAGIALLK